MSGSKVGSLPWLRDNAGQLTGRDHLVLAGQAVRAQVEVTMSLIRRVGGLSGVVVNVGALDSMRAPDTVAASRAYEENAAVSSPALLNHCLRTYLWGRILAVQEGHDFDDEAYYIASLYHDYGLTDIAQDAPCQCFTQTSVDAVNTFAVSESLDPARAEMIADAIAMHINVGVFPADGPEAYLLHHATTMDCTGLRLWELSRDVREAVQARHPRGEFTKEVDAAFQREVKRCPNTRMQFLYRYAFFGTLMRFGPLKGG